MNETGQCS